MHRHVLLGDAAWVVERFGTLVPRECYRAVALNIADDQLELTMATHRPPEGGVAGSRARATDNRDEVRGILDRHTELADESRLPPGRSG